MRPSPVLQRQANFLYRRVRARVLQQRVRESQFCILILCCSRGSLCRVACENCPAGQYQFGSGQADCADCVPGQYQATFGQPKCLDCEVGKQQPLTGQSKCDFVLRGNAGGKAPCNTLVAGICVDDVEGAAAGAAAGDVAVAAVEPIAAPVSGLNTAAEFLADLTSPAVKAAIKAAPPVCPTNSYLTVVGGIGVYDCVTCPVGKFQPYRGKKNCVTKLQVRIHTFWPTMH